MSYEPVRAESFEAKLAVAEAKLHDTQQAHAACDDALEDAQAKLKAPCALTAVVRELLEAFREATSHFTYTAQRAGEVSAMLDRAEAAIKEGDL